MFILELNDHVKYRYADWRISLFVHIPDSRRHFLEVLLDADVN